MKQCRNRPTARALWLDHNAREDATGAIVNRPERWIPLLQSCESERQLVDVLRDFLASIPPADLAAIPATAGIASLEGAVDVAGMAVSIAREDLLFDGEPSSKVLLGNVSKVFAAAATRLAEIQSQRLRDRLE